jgi:hypothetical protein
MKIIFLDIDGVIASLDHIRITSLLEEDNPDKYGYAFDPRCVKNLQYIIKQTNAKLIISSSWKSMGKEALLTMWKMRELPGEIIGTTPDLLRGSRGMEIQVWIDTNDVTKFVIIDDDIDMLDSQSPYFVKTNPIVGLTVEDSIKVITILK